MIKYMVSHNNQLIEFTSFDAATSFKNENNIATEIQEIEEMAVVAKVIEDVTPRQMRQALILNGISMNMIESAINSLPSPQKELAIVEWEYSTTFQRNNPLVTMMGSMLGWSGEQIDNLWMFAKTL